MFKRKSPEEKARLEAENRKRKADEDERKRLERFTKSPAGQARAAKMAGAKIFQYVALLSQTSADVIAMTGAFTSVKDSQHAAMLDSIEAEGWLLEHAGYVYRVTRSISRDKLLSSGQQEAVEGEIVGIYIFRIKANKVANSNANSDDGKIHFLCDKCGTKFVTTKDQIGKSGKCNNCGAPILVRV